MSTLYSVTGLTGHRAQEHRDQARAHLQPSRAKAARGPCSVKVLQPVTEALTLYDISVSQDTGTQDSSTGFTLAHTLQPGRAEAGCGPCQWPNSSAGHYGGADPLNDCTPLLRALDTDTQGSSQGAPSAWPGEGGTRPRPRASPRPRALACAARRATAAARRLSAAICRASAAAAAAASASAAALAMRAACTVRIRVA